MQNTVFDIIFRQAEWTIETKEQNVAGKTNKAKIKLKPNLITLHRHFFPYASPNIEIQKWRRVCWNWRLKSKAWNSHSRRSSWRQRWNSPVSPTPTYSWSSILKRVEGKSGVSLVLWLVLIGFLPVSFLCLFVFFALKIYQFLRSLSSSFLPQCKNLPPPLTSPGQIFRKRLSLQRLPQFSTDSFLWRRPSVRQSVYQRRWSQDAFSRSTPASSTTTTSSASSLSFSFR